MSSMRVQILLSDPWELGESIKWRPLPGELTKMVVDDSGGRALIRFDDPILYRGSQYRFAVAAPRHEGKTLEALRQGGKVFCSFTAVSDEHAQSDKALSTEHWRGGLAFIGDVEGV